MKTEDLAILKTAIGAKRAGRLVEEIEEDLSEVGRDIELLGDAMDVPELREAARKAYESKQALGRLRLRIEQRRVELEGA